MYSNINAKKGITIESSYKSIRNGVIASTIAGIIVLLIPKLREYVISFFLWLWYGIVWCWKALFVSYNLPGWVLLIISLLALFAIAVIFLIVKENRSPEFKAYTEDFLFDTKWRWYWSGNNIANLWCYCPSCDATLVYDDSSCHNRYIDSKTDFICENCGSKVVASITGGNKDYSIGAVKREIDRRIRTGDYKNTLKNETTKTLLFVDRVAVFFFICKKSKPCQFHPPIGYRHKSFHIT